MFSNRCHFVPYFLPHSAQAAALSGCSGWTGNSLVAGIFPGGIVAANLDSDPQISLGLGRWLSALSVGLVLQVFLKAGVWGLVRSLIP